MIILIKHLSKTYDIIVSSLSDLYLNELYQIQITDQGQQYTLSGKLFANVIYMPSGPTEGIWKPTEQNKILIANDLYEQNRSEILDENKNKFIIAVVKLLPDNTKEILYINSYLSLLNNTDEYNKLLSDSPYHHYEIYNYKTNEFDVFIKRDDAIQQLNDFTNQFVFEYKTNIVLEFSSSQDFLSYINTLESL